MPFVAPALQALHADFAPFAISHLERLLIGSPVGLSVTIQASNLC
jgi:hypothetical protein